MSTPEGIRETKRRISSALLDTPGISGVGLRGERVVIWPPSRLDVRFRSVVASHAFTH